MAEIVSHARSGDNGCREIFDRFLDDFGRCLGGLISILDPDAIVLGGGLSNIDELYTTGIDRVRRYAFHDDLRTPIMKNSLGDSAGVFGAAWLNPDIPLGGAQLLHEPCRTHSGILPPGFLANSPAIASSTGQQATRNMSRQHLCPNGKSGLK
jgi:hypothetical protein